MQGFDFKVKVKDLEFLYKCKEFAYYLIKALIGFMSNCYDDSSRAKVRCVPEALLKGLGVLRPAWGQG